MDIHTIRGQNFGLLATMCASSTGGPWQKLRRVPNQSHPPLLRSMWTARDVCAIKAQLTWKKLSSFLQTRTNFIFPLALVNSLPSSSVGLQPSAALRLYPPGFCAHALRCRKALLKSKPQIPKVGARGHGKRTVNYHSYSWVLSTRLF